MSKVIRRFFLSWSLVILFLVDSGPVLAQSCDPPQSIPSGLHSVSTYLRLYPSESFARSNSTELENIIAGLSGSDGHVVYSDRSVSGLDAPMSVILPVWVSTARLDIEAGTMGDASWSVGRVYKPNNPTDTSQHMAGAFTGAAQNLSLIHI